MASGGAAGAVSLSFVYSLDYARTRLANDAKSSKKVSRRAHCMHAMLMLARSVPCTIVLLMSIVPTQKQHHGELEVARPRPVFLLLTTCFCSKGNEDA